MILADTSVWIDHLNQADRILLRLLESDEIAAHPFVIGELAMGRWPDRAVIVRGLRRLETVYVARNEEVLQLIEDWEVAGTGIGYMDVHLLASVLLTPETRLWTRDKRLREVAKQLSLDAKLN
jgi:predicted nucleic acid-binding protein